jgi:hypothetical protein
MNIPIIKKEMYMLDSIGYNTNEIRVNLVVSIKVLIHDGLYALLS